MLVFLLMAEFRVVETHIGLASSVVGKWINLPQLHKHMAKTGQEGLRGNTVLLAKSGKTPRQHVTPESEILSWLNQLRDQNEF